MQWLVIAIYGTRTTQQDADFTAYLSRCFGDVHAGYLSLKSFHHITGRSSQYLGTFDRGYRSCQIPLFDGTVSYYYHFVNQSGIFHHRDFQFAFIACADFLFYVSHVRYFEYCVGRHTQCEESVYICNSPVVCAFFYNISSDYRLPLRVFHYAGDASALLAVDLCGSDYRYYSC